MEKPRFIPVEVEVTIGREIVKLSFQTSEDFDQWWVKDDTREIPRFGAEMLGEDF